MKTLNIIAAILIFTAITFAANEKAPSKPIATSTINGKVIDKNTGEALAGVKIAINKTGDEVYTDLDGNFEIVNVKRGINKIETNLISYSTASIDIDCTTISNNIEIKLVNN